MSPMLFRENPHSIFVLMSRNSSFEKSVMKFKLLQRDSYPQLLACKKQSTILQNGPNEWALSWVLTSMVHLTLHQYHVTYAFQSESTLYLFLKVKELLTQNKRNIWSLSDCNRTQTHIHLARKWILNHLAKLAKYLSCVGSTYLYGVFDSMLLSCNMWKSEWIHTLHFLNVKELLAQNKRDIWSLSDCNLTQTQIRLAQQGTLNHLAKLAK